MVALSFMLWHFVSWASEGAAVFDYDVTSVTFLGIGPTATYLSLYTHLQVLFSKSILYNDSTLVALDVSDVLIADSPVFIELINTNCD